MSKGNWGGSAAGGGLEFQAAVSAWCMVYVASGMPLGWMDTGGDIPLSISAETAGAGDDIALQLVSGDTLEIQVKRKLRANSELWDALIALCRHVHENPTFHGVLVVGPTTSTVIRDQLARDIVRIGQGRKDDLSTLAITFAEKLTEALVPLQSCSRVRIQTLHLLEQDNASTHSALAHLAHLTTQPDQTWERLRTEGLRLIRLRGRKDAISIAGIIPGLRANIPDPLAPAYVANKLLEWTLSTTKNFSIPAVEKLFSLDDDWIELDAYTRDRDVSLGNLEEALTNYHEGHSKKKARSEREKFKAEGLGYFVRQCVVIAGPGMGKTLLLQRISRLLSRKREPVLLVRLRPLAERMRAGETFLEAAFHIGLDSSPLNPKDVRTLGIQNLTFLLDGLDESGAEQEQIAKETVALVAAYPSCRIVFTTRPIGYETSLLSAWKHYELTLVESSDAKESVKRLVDAVAEPENPKVKEATAAATSHMDYTRNYQFSARTPLLIALLASLALNEVLAAATREGLYEQLFGLIERASVVKRSAISLTPAVLNAFLQRLGWELTAEPYADLQKITTQCAGYIAHELDERPLKAHAICNEALEFWEKVGFVERVRFRTSEALTFVHKTFGEFAAARYVCSRSHEERLKLLETIEPESKWSEVNVFAAALGFGPDLVQLALSRPGENDSESARLFQWAKHSRDALSNDLAKLVLQRVWPIVVGPHSGSSLRVGVYLIDASDKLPGLSAYSESCRSHHHWWTALVGWACFVRVNPTQLDFSALMAFIESYAEDADTRQVTRGLNLNDPVRDLWNELLLASAVEAVRRGLGPEEKKFIDYVQGNLNHRSVSFIRKLTSILKKVGVEVKFPGNESLRDYIDPDYFKKSRQNILALLEAIAAGASYAETSSIDSPLLHLSAFWYGTGFMEMPISEVRLAAKASGKDELGQLVGLAARLSSYDYGQLVAETKTRIRALKSDDGGLTSFDGLMSVDAPIHFHGKPDGSARPMITKALLHPSEWVVYLAANLAECLLTAADIEKLVPQVLLESEGTGTVAAEHLAAHFFGKEKARDLVVSRLKQPLNTGSQYLFTCLAKNWTPELDAQMYELVKPALFFGPRTAKAALKLAQVCSEPHRKSLSSLLKEAYDYWLVNEEPYPTEGGTIPDSPRGEILGLLIKEDSANCADLFEAAKDPRHEVSNIARVALVKMLSMMEAARDELVNRIGSGEQLDSLLMDSLRAHTPFSEKNLRSIAELLESERPETRYAAIGVLDLQYMQPEEIRRWAEKLTSDPYQHLRDKGHECLSALRILE